MMNPYVRLGSAIGTDEAASLGARLTAWHDAMVAHERRMRGRQQDDDDCWEGCPHAEARDLWPEVVATFGDHADGLIFLRSRALGRRVPDGERERDASAAAR